MEKGWVIKMSDYNVIYPKTLIDNSTPLTYETWNSSTDSIIGINNNQEFSLAPLGTTAWSCNSIFIIPVIRNVNDNVEYYENPLGVTQNYIEQAFSNGNEVLFYFIDLSVDERITRRVIELEYYPSGDLLIGDNVTINSSGLIQKHSK